MSQSLVVPKQQQIMEVLHLRYWQHILNEDLKNKLFKIPIHLAFGHEAIAVAVNQMMKEKDQLVLTHRNVAYNLARAGSLEPIYAEYKLSTTGVAHGKLGSMNLVNPEKNVVYSSSILGNNISIACGLALGKKILNHPGIVIVLMGDGSIEEGIFYEGLTFARSHNLKLLVIVENNNHSMASAIADRRCPISLADICKSLNIPFTHLWSNNIFEYLSTLNTIRTTVDESTPVCVEVQLAMLNQHAGPTPGWPTDPMSISIKHGLIIEETINDPVFVLKQQIDTQIFNELTSQIFAKEWSRPND